MVTIRLQRRGGKKEPFYHVVVTDSRRAGGGSLEQVGAQASDRVQQLLKVFRKTQVAAAA